ncbi:hypothetical protein I4U23_020351 [Adineta vaga]|nr:hypothetical protein I4U23_020351 [Adineta vaga]
MSDSFIRDQPYLLKDRAVALSIPKLVICSLCQGVLWLPIACQTCDTPFCISCIKNWKVDAAEPHLCPHDNHEYIQRKCPSGNMYALSKLQITCRYKPHGCSESLPYNNLETHEETCDYRLKTCSGCSAEFTKMNFNEHYRGCPFVLLKCNECATDFQRQYQVEHTEINCLRIQLHKIRDERENYRQKQSELISYMESRIDTLASIVELLLQQNEKKLILLNMYDTF